jgi:hypothetical protein
MPAPKGQQTETDMGIVMVLLQRLGLLPKTEALATRFDERLTRTCQREQMLSTLGRSGVRTPAEHQAA